MTEGFKIQKQYLDSQTPETPQCLNKEWKVSVRKRLTSTRSVKFCICIIKTFCWSLKNLLVRILSQIALEIMWLPIQIPQSKLGLDAISSSRVHFSTQLNPICFRHSYPVPCSFRIWVLNQSIVKSTWIFSQKQNCQLFVHKCNWISSGYASKWSRIDHDILLRMTSYGFPSLFHFHQVFRVRWPPFLNKSLLYCRFTLILR